jgi:hypothetical protein
MHLHFPGYWLLAASYYSGFVMDDCPDPESLEKGK